jgi:hypothetical protein
MNGPNQSWYKGNSKTIGFGVTTNVSYDMSIDNGFRSLTAMQKLSTALSVTVLWDSRSCESIHSQFTQESTK